MKYTFYRISISLFSIIFFFGITFSQGIAIGEWREHLPYSRVISVAIAEDVIYAATEYAIIKYDKNEETIERLSKINMLSDIGITRIAYHQQLKTLIITYQNGNIDLLKNNSIRHIGDIKRSPISENKRINNIRLLDHYAYLSCNFGIVVLDLKKNEISDTYIIGANGSMTEVYDLVFFKDTIYAASKQGIMYANKKSQNLANFNNWHIDSTLIKKDYYCNILHVFNNKLIANLTKNYWDTDTLYMKEENKWNKILDGQHGNRTQIKSYDDLLVIAQPAALFLYNDKLEEVNRIWNLGIDFPMPNDFEREAYNTKSYWIGDNNNGLIRNYNFWNNDYFTPAGPYSSKVYKIFGTKDYIIGVPGARDISWNNTYQYGGLFAFQNEHWTNIHKKSINAFDTLYDFMSVVIHPANPEHWFIGSYSRGIIELNNKQLTHIWNGYNTTINGTSNNPKDVRISGLAFDKNYNLWAVSSFSSQCLHVKTPNGTWHSFSIPLASSSDVYAGLTIDRNGNKWMPLPKGGGILVFNDNDTPSNKTDDKYIKLTTGVGSGNLPSTRVFAVAEDHDGRIWVGTEVGIAVFYYPHNLFTNQNFDAQQILVEVGGHVQPLLESESINCITIDGANRKWIGTEKAGVFLLSPDGTKQIQHFTEENSPLLSNSVSTIAIHPSSGEVFFGTSAGIVSYKSTATEGIHQYVEETNKVYAYPNPVKPDYNGYIAIKNLVTNSHIKITDIYGNLIYQTIALGGQAVWDGRFPNGEKPKSGIFLVFITNDDGSESMVSKILFVN